MFVFDLGGQGGPVRRRGVRAEPGLFFGTEMLWTVGGGYHFDVGECGLRSLVWLIVDSSIGNLNFVADEWQVEPFCPSCREKSPEKLKEIIDDTLSYLTLKICATCKKYFKWFDLDKEPDAHPFADDFIKLASSAKLEEAGFHVF